LRRWDIVSVRRCVVHAARRQRDGTPSPRAKLYDYRLSKLNLIADEVFMDREFWQARWDEGRIGFHQDDVNPYLRRYWPGMNIPVDNAVFVPLCGKSKDMLRLRAQGHAVMGVEVVARAVEAFFAENALPVTPRRHGGVGERRHPYLLRRLLRSRSRRSGRRRRRLRSRLAGGTAARAAHALCRPSPHCPAGADGCAAGDHGLSADRDGRASPCGDRTGGPCALPAAF